MQNLPNPFMYHDEIVDSDFVNKFKRLDPDEIFLLMEEGRVTMSDFFVVMAIAKLHFGTRQTIEAYVAWHKERNPELAVISPDAVHDRLNQLQKAGIVASFSLFHGLKRPRQPYYALTQHAIPILKARLGFDDYYNRYNVHTPADEVVKQLSVNSVLLHLLKAGHVQDFTCSRSMYDKTVNSVDKYNLHASVTTKVGDEEYGIIIEGLHGNYNANRITSKRQSKIVIDRLKLISSAVRQNKDAGKKSILIFVTEDMIRLQKNMNLIGRLFPEMIHFSYFTTPTVVHKYGISNSLVRVTQLTDEGKASKVVNAVNEIFY